MAINLGELIGKIIEESFWVGLFALVFLIAPGLMIIFYFYPDLFLSIDTIKLILLSLAFTTPVVLINMFLFGKIMNKKSNIAVDSIFAIFLTSSIIYIGLFISYLFKLSFGNFIFLNIVLEIILIILISTILVSSITNSSPILHKDLREVKGIKDFFKISNKIKKKYFFNLDRKTRKFLK